MQESERTGPSGRVLVVGGGASGVLLAVHLLRDGDWPRVTIVESRDGLGAGVAYATDHPDHYLNVRASNMSAFPDDPSHFVRWAHGGGRPGLGPQDFAPRHVYRDYLAGLIAPLLADGSLEHVRSEAVAIREMVDRVAVRCADGAVLEGDTAVIATGNEAPDLPPEPWRIDGWSASPELLPALDAPVVVIGTGLTMVDRVIALLHTGHRGRITAVSRRGLVPHVHAPVQPQTIAAEEIPFGGTSSCITRWMRRRVGAVERGGGGWRDMVDGLRPHTQALWQSLSQADRQRFLRHARPFWDTHRHRIAPEVARRLQTARASGQFGTIAAHVAGFAPSGDGVTVQLTLSGTGRREDLPAAAVFECRGRSPDITRSGNPILLDLLRTGTGCPDDMRLGLAVTADCALIGADGRASARLHALGPVTSGSFWEVVAIPDIRQQAQRLATLLRIARI